MKVSLEKLPTSEAVLEVEIPWDEMEKASDKAYRKLVKQVDVPGFRRGKAPRSLLERKLGKEYIYQEGLDELISNTYRDAMKDHDLTPITQPKLDAPVFEIGQPYHFNITVPIITPPVLGDYRSLHFERPDADVTSEEVETELETMRSRRATWETVERPADYDDRVTVDLKLTVEEKSISDLKDNPFELTRERYGLFSGMDEHVVGMQVGETKSFTTTIPADYGNDKLAGQSADFVVTLHKVEEKHLPELDDAFAAQASNGQAETLEDLRKSISDEILENKQRGNRNELREKVLNAVIEQTQFNIHPLLIDDEAENMLHQLEHLLERQRMSVDQYLAITHKTRKQFLEESRPQAEQAVKRQLVLDAIVNKEEIAVDPTELENIFNAYVQMGQELPRSDEQIRALAMSYLREKALTRLVELTTDPDPAAESEDEETEEASIANAEAASLIDASLPDEEAQSTDTQPEESTTLQTTETQ